MISVGSNLRPILEERGISFRQISDETGVARVTLYHISNGRRDGNITTLWAIADYLKVSLDELVGRVHYEGQK